MAIECNIFVLLSKLKSEKDSRSKCLESHLDFTWNDTCKRSLRLEALWISLTLLHVCYLCLQKAKAKHRQPYSKKPHSYYSPTSKWCVKAFSPPLRLTKHLRHWWWWWWGKVQVLLCLWFREIFESVSQGSGGVVEDQRYVSCQNDEQRFPLPLFAVSLMVFPRQCSQEKVKMSVVTKGWRGEY